MTARPRLLFVAPWFLFPTVSGGRIRTTDILRGMKGGAFDITLLSPLPPEPGSHARELEGICDRFDGWSEEPHSVLSKVLSLPSRLPVSVAMDRSPRARAMVAAELSKQPDVVVFDFVHTAVLAPERLPAPGVVFTHNVESEIYRRQAGLASNPLKKQLWRNQLAKMQRFEGEALRSFRSVVAVSERDGEAFREEFGIENVSVIPTGVNLEFFTFAEPPQSGDATAGGSKLVFTGTMDYLPNTDAIEAFLEGAWPRIAAASPKTELVVVGKNPPQQLLDEVKRRDLPWTFTGFVDDVRPYVHGADVYVIPLRIGGGTRLKVFEAMSMGCPVVSTAIGVEGLEIEPGRHYLEADEPEAFADAVLRLLREGEERRALAQRAREHVERNFSSQAVARLFEGICLEAAGLARSGAPA